MRIWLQGSRVEFSYLTLVLMAEQRTSDQPSPELKQPQFTARLVHQHGSVEVPLEDYHGPVDTYHGKEIGQCYFGNPDFGYLDSVSSTSSQGQLPSPDCSRDYASSLEYYQILPGQGTGKHSPSRCSQGHNHQSQQVHPPFQGHAQNCPPGRVRSNNNFFKPSQENAQHHQTSHKGCHEDNHSQDNCVISLAGPDHLRLSYSSPELAAFCPSTSQNQEKR